MKEQKTQRGGGLGISSITSIAGGRVSPSLIILISIVTNIYYCLVCIDYLGQIEETESDPKKCGEIDETKRKFLKGTDITRIIIISLLILLVISQ